MTNEGEYVRYNVRLREQLREDAKRNTDRGELAESVREVFRRKAYGVTEDGRPSEVEQTKAELREVRDRIDKLRRQRTEIQAEIEAQETRATRLEERITELKEDREELTQALTMLENMLQDGDRMWPIRIKNAVEVDIETAKELHQELRGRNSELPDAAFREPGLHDPTDWRE